MSWVYGDHMDMSQGEQMNELPNYPVIVVHLADKRGRTVCTGDEMPLFDDDTTPRYLCPLCARQENGRELMTRAEWEETIDYEAAKEELRNHLDNLRETSSPTYTDEALKAAAGETVDAALKGGS